MSRRIAVVAAAAALAVTMISWRANADGMHGRVVPAKSSEVTVSGPKSSEGVVNLNDATEEQLTLLPGIGPAKAKAIVAQRHGHPFRRADELTKVKGIGRKTFGRLRPYITTVGATTLSTEVKRQR
ncbi:MAG: Late competence protein ComEA, receptor [Myxococcales bacterium]|nr:Late competence protein ComEA, receptor [Myxococcales bacterium]